MTCITTLSPIQEICCHLLVRKMYYHLSTGSSTCKVGMTTSQPTTAAQHKLHGIEPLVRTHYSLYSRYY